MVACLDNRLEVLSLLLLCMLWTPTWLPVADCSPARLLCVTDRLLRERIRKSRSAQALDNFEDWDKWEQDLQR